MRQSHRKKENNDVCSFPVVKILFHLVKVVWTLITSVDKSQNKISWKKILRVNIYLCPTKIRNFHPGRFLTSHNSSLEGIPLIFNGILDWLCLLSMLFWVQFCFLGADVLAQLFSTRQSQSNFFFQEIRADGALP